MKTPHVEDWKSLFALSVWDRLRYENFLWTFTNLVTLSPSSPPFQQLSFLHSGLLSNLYLHRSDCPVPLLRWLFQVRAKPTARWREHCSLIAATRL